MKSGKNLRMKRNGYFARIHANFNWLSPEFLLAVRNRSWKNSYEEPLKQNYKFKNNNNNKNNKGDLEASKIRSMSVLDNGKEHNGFLM